MGALLELPEKGRSTEEDLSAAVDALLQPAIAERNIHQVGWWIIDAYMQGVRSFNVLDFEQGTVEVSYEDDDGDLHLRWEEPLTRIETEIGRLSRLDTRPQANKREHSLESLRNSSIAQIALDQMTALVDWDGLSLEFITGLVLYGMYGKASWPDQNSTSPMGHVVELIPPWELLSIPAGFMNPTDRRGIVRTRLFPLVQLQRLRGVRMPKDEGLLEIVELPYGTDMGGINPAGPGPAAGAGGLTDMFDEEASGGTTAGGQKRREFKPQRRAEKFVRLREVFLDGPQETVSRYIARAGRAIVMDEDFINDGVQVPKPIGIAHHGSGGRFYRTGFAGKIVPFALEMEELLEKLIQHAADMDRFGFFMVPNTLGVDLDDLKATETPRIVPYEPDLGAPNLSVENIAPATANDFPGRVFQAGIGVLDRIVAQGPMLQGDAPGRADSGQAFSVLSEAGSTHLLPVAQRIESAYRTVYRSMLYNLRQRFVTGGATDVGLEITRLENSIAGVVINPETGRLELQADQLPDPFAVELTIRSKNPTAGERRRQEAIGMLQMGTLSPLEFIIMNYREDWGFPIGNRAVWENYIKAVLHNLILFGDGQTPGTLPGADLQAGDLGRFFSPLTDKAEVHLLAIEDFTSGPEFSLASDIVRRMFEERIKAIKEMAGDRLPTGAPPLDQAAIQAAAQAQEARGLPPGA